MKLPIATGVLMLLALSGCRSTPRDPVPPALHEPLRVLILGDSISIGYTPYVRDALAGRALVVRPEREGSPENCAGTTHGVQHLERWLALEGGGWDVIHFNFGLHDLKRVDALSGQNSDRPEDPRQAEPARYAEQLERIVARLQQTGARLVFATTTPVPAGELRPHREPADALEYNRIALAIAQRAGVRVDDLHGLVAADPRALQRPANVHFTAEGSRVLGQAVAASILAAAGRPAGPALVPVLLNDDGGWCWFQDERALALGELVLVGSVAAGQTDPQRRGDIELSAWWPASGVVQRVELHDRLELDDHDAPALLELDDGRLLAVYATHGHDHSVRWRRSVHPGDPLTWEPERTLEVAADQRLGVTYANLHRDGERGELLDLFRGEDWDPNLIVSRDQGETWEWVGRVLGGPGRPYLKYASDGRGSVHLIATEQHPRDFDNSLYHGSLNGRELRRSDGTPVGGVGPTPPAPGDLTRVFVGGPNAVAWPVDLELDAEGRPVALFSVQVDGAGLPPRQGGLDHRLYHARFDGRRWHSELLGHAGTRLYAGEDDYTGLAALDPGDPTVVYLSSDADPRTGRALISAADGQRHHELFRARRTSAGWTFEALTASSSADNLRPIVPAGSPRVLLWLRGELRSYTDYSLEVLGAPLDP